MEHFTVPPGLGGSAKKNSTRNMTGIYLGMDGKSSPPQEGGTGGQPRHSIPPLARGRGIRVKTPVEHQRYKKVEMFRAREESRGFPAKQPIKRVKYSRRPRQTEETSSYPGQPVSPGEFKSITKKTWRNYTQILNNGMQRLEYLNLDVNNPNKIHAEPRVVKREPTSQHGHAPEDPVSEENLYDEIRRVVTLSEYQSNPQALHGLLPQRRAHTHHGTRRPKFLTTPLTIKSLRNPERPTEIVQFAEVDRPRSTPNPRPLLPTPYFYSVNKALKARSSLGPRKLGQPEEKRSMIPVFLGPETFRQSSASSSPPHDNPGTLQGTNKWIPGLGAGPATASLGSANGHGTSFLARHMGRRGSGGILDGRKTNTPVSQLLEGPDAQLEPAAINEEDVIVSLPSVIPEGTSEPSEVTGNGKVTENNAPCETETGKETNNVENTNSGESVPNGDIRTTAEREIPIHDNWESAAPADNQGPGDCGMDEENEKEETSTPGLNVVIDIHVESAPEEPGESADDTPPHMDPGFSATQMAEAERRRTELARLLEEHAQLVQNINQAEESVGSR
ncbi:Hypp2806 [Branchiostoma lanceolatum]|uniref:Hypp2806 protein n=1 Tax=Branchiostoma lanceolatum TaxID=7740 RepID=A0A8K0ES23_BRALA|nr:Hypp2806 [Branchiostoma lanceolatum]